ncbi:uncharacterized protein K452DRAFT_323293 [Neofusicoccum parvum]|nr:uncharacterized protein K452DRAFT_323293 [Neofusicoccum parvum]
MAIGALSMWHRQSPDQSLRAVSVPAVPTPERDSHYFHAVAHYCHSLKLQSQGASVQDAVFLSLLLLFFEALRGNRKAALDHVNHGLALILNLLTDANTQSLIADVAPNPKPLIAAVADIFTHLATQARIVFRGRVGHGPPLPNLAKGLKSKQHTMESFLVLLSQLPRPNTTSRIPTAFKTFDEFEQHWDAARRRQTSLTRLMTDLMRDHGALDSHDPATIVTFYQTLLHHPRILAFCTATRSTLQALDTALLPLFHTTLATTPPTSPPHLRALHLRLQLLAVSLFDDAPQYASAAALAARTPLFREHLALAARAVRAAPAAATNPAQRLSLQCGLAWSLLATALLCRDGDARAQAVALLRAYPAQDGVLSARALAALAARNQGVEAAGVAEEEGGGAEERWRRLCRREFVFEDGGERVVFRFLERDEVTGEWGPVEEVAEIGPEGEDVVWRRQPLTAAGGLLLGDLHAG